MFSSEHSAEYRLWLQLDEYFKMGDDHVYTLRCYLKFEKWLRHNFNDVRTELVPEIRFVGTDSYCTTLAFVHQLLNKADLHCWLILQKVEE